ncbi:hypothetical protein HN51_024102 [Arachis hypogaea]
MNGRRREPNACVYTSRSITGAGFRGGGAVSCMQAGLQHASRVVQQQHWDSAQLYQASRASTFHAPCVVSHHAPGVLPPGSPSQQPRPRRAATWLSRSATTPPAY